MALVLAIYPLDLGAGGRGGAGPIEVTLAVLQPAVESSPVGIQIIHRNLGKEPLRLQTGMTCGPEPSWVDHLFVDGRELAVGPPRTCQKNVPVYQTLSPGASYVTTAGVPLPAGEHRLRAEYAPTEVDAPRAINHFVGRVRSNEVRVNVAPRTVRGQLE